MAERQLALYDATDIKRLSEKIDRISVDIAEIKVKVAGLVDQHQHLQSRITGSERRINLLESRLAGLKMIGITIAALWGVLTTVIGLWLNVK